MNKQELIEKYVKFEEEVRKQGWNIEDLGSFDRGELAGESQLLSMLLNDLKQLEEPKITEEQAFIEHLTRLFKKHGYDHLGQVALALENSFEISINKELPAIPLFLHQKHYK